MLLTHCIRLAASRAACTAGKSKAISTAMIAITTSSSIRVKARGLRRALRIDWRLLVLEREAGITTRDQVGRGSLLSLPPTPEKAKAADTKKTEDSQNFLALASWCATRGG